MAARTNKNKDHRIPVTDIAHWNKELSFGGIVVAEVFSSWFGPCEALTPTVQQLMLDIDDAPNKIKWLLVNVAKLEEQQVKQRQEEEKKQKENEIAQRRKAEGEGKSDEKDASASHSVASDASSVTIPLLEKYAGYEHPRPLWVFIQDKKVLGEMRSANPPRLKTILAKYMAGEPVEAEVLPEPVLPKEFQAKAAVAAAPVEASEAKDEAEDQADQEDLEDVDVSNPAAKSVENESEETAKPAEEDEKAAEPVADAPAPVAEEAAPPAESKTEEPEPAAAAEEKEKEAVASEEPAPAVEAEKEKTPSEAPAAEAKEPGSKRGTATQAVLTKMGSQLNKGSSSRRSTLNASESKTSKK